MERQLTHMVRLVDDLLDVSRISRGRVELRKELVDLRSVTQEAAESTRPMMEGGGHEVTIDAGMSPLPVEGDRTRLTQIVSNLLSNAAKYTPRRGRIDISLQQHGHDAVLRIVDTGIGFALSS